jgi:hypothetical protein
MRDQAGQLGDSGEYRMVRGESWPHDIWSYDSSSPHLCRLRTASIGPPATSIDYVLMHTDYMGLCKPSSIDGH